LRSPRRAEALARAKVNLTLHVTGRRADGYHLLDSLVAFAPVGDRITAVEAGRLTLAVEGPEAAWVPAGDDNLVLRAARFLDPAGTAAITLTKHLPTEAGLGGGSADAAATLRALGELWQDPLPDAGDTAVLGADVPVCLDGRTRRMRGIGEVLSEVPVLPEMDILLVNPRVPAPTAAVFAGLTRRDNPAMPDALPDWPDVAAFCLWLEGQRNDLAAPALLVAPVIAEVLALIRDAGAMLAGMSGSGATCFGLFPPDRQSAEAAERHVRSCRPDWWLASGRLS
jgi:4-diphosphocytidyl-2-C-methyl-D-erythritol kinase